MNTKEGPFYEVTSRDWVCSDWTLDVVFMVLDGM